MNRLLPIGFLAVCFTLPAVTACSGRGENAASERPPVAVEIGRVALGDLTESIAVVGTLLPKFEGEVKAEYSGTVTDVYVTEWVHVAKGTLLARFDRREPEAILQAATAARLQAAVASTRASRELDRAVKLKAAGLATQQQLDDARSAAEAAAAQLNAAKAQVEMAHTRLLKTEVRAPIDGVIAQRIVNPGSYVQNMGSESKMFRIVDNRLLELTVSIPSTQIAAVKLGQPLSFTTDAVPGRTFEGRVSFINPAADEGSRTVPVVAIVENSSGALKSGLFAKGVIITGRRSGVLRAPRSAMLTWDPATRKGVVFVVTGDRVQRKDVVTGSAAAEDVEITNGLTAGDTVVTRGAFNLRDGDRVAVARPVAEGIAEGRGPRAGGEGRRAEGSDPLALGPRPLALDQPRNLVTG
jgi:membrane fusion protein, multidrug efflux system